MHIYEDRDMNNIVWRNEIGYVMESPISYRVYFVHMDGIVQCFHLTPEGLEKAKKLLTDAAEREYRESCV